MNTRKIGVSTLRRLVREATAGERAREINVTSAKDRPQGATFWTELPEDQEYWEKQWGVKTGEDLDRTLAIQTYSDVYKELYGSRPSVSSLKSMPVGKIEAMIDELYASGADEDYDYAPADDYEYNFAPEVTPEDPDDEYASYASPKSSGMGRRLEAFVGSAKGRWALVVEAAREECDECGMEEVSEADENEVDECGMKEASEVDECGMEEVAPPGWERTVKKMKSEPDVENPWALAWWMKGRGYEPGEE